MSKFFPTWWTVTVLLLSGLGLYACSGYMMRDLNPRMHRSGAILGSLISQAHAQTPREGTTAIIKDGACICQEGDTQ